MSVYLAHLPKAFPVGVTGPEGWVREALKALLDPQRPDVTDGSSFAVTVDAPEGWTLWLSQTSAERLINQGLLPREALTWTPT